MQTNGRFAATADRQGVMLPAWLLSTIVCIEGLMKLSIHIHFNGRCQEAFEYYSDLLGGQIGAMPSFADSPAANSVSPDWQRKIVHANINIGGIEIAGDDVPSTQYVAPNGFYILLAIDSEEKTRSISESLAKGGHILFPLQKTFWSPCYGILIDRYGVPWKLNSSA